MNFNPVNKGVITISATPIEYQEDVKDVFMHTSDKRPKGWFDSKSSQAISSTLRPYNFNFSGVPANGFESLKKQIEDIEWADDEDKQNAYQRIKNFNEDKIELLSDLLTKMEDLSDDLKKAASVGSAAYYCQTAKNDEIEKIKNFNAENYNKLNEDLRKNYAQTIMKTCPELGIEDPDGINSLYEVLDDETRDNAFSSILFLLGNEESHKAQTERAKAVLPLNPALRQKINVCDIISKSKLAPNIMKRSVEYLNGIDIEKSSNLDRYYISHLLQTDYSYSLDNAQNQPVCGTSDFRKFRTKEEMKKELASMRDENGKFGFSNNVIDKIINNENDIGELSILLDGIKKSGVDFSFYNLREILMTEGLTLKNAQERLDFIAEVNKNPEYECILDAINSNKPEIVTMGGKDFEKVKNNMPLIKTIESYYPEIFKDKDDYSSNSNNSSCKFRILEDSVVTPENFKKLVKAGFISNNFDLYRLNDILKDDSFNNIKDENIELYNSLKNDKRLEFLFYEEENGEKKPKDTSYILKAKLPEGFDITQKEELIDFISELRNDAIKSGRMQWEGDRDYFQILLTGNNEEVSCARQIKDYLHKKNLFTDCDMYKYFTSHSFKETIELINRYETSSLNENSSAIYRSSVKANNDFLDVVDYIAGFDELKGAEIRASDITADMEYDKTGKLSVENQKKKIDRLVDVSKLMGKNVWQSVKSYALYCALTKDINFSDEGVKYFSDFYENKELEKYFNLTDYNLLDLMQMSLDIETLRENQPKLLEFVKKYKENEKDFELNFYGKELAGFDGDILKLDDKIQSLKEEYGITSLNLSFDEKGTITFEFDDKDGLEIEILTDKNMNVISENASCSYRDENGKVFNLYAIEDKERNLQHQVTKTNDPLYHEPICVQMQTAYLDESGNELKTKTYEKSEVDGVVSIYEQYPDGTIKTLSSASSTPDGLGIKKELESPSGVKSFVDYKQKEDGSEVYEYRIADKDGNELLNLVRTVDVIDENTKITTVNDRKYQVKFSDGFIDILDFQTNEETRIDLSRINPQNIPALNDLLNSLSGDELIKIGECVKELILTDRIASAMNWVTGEMEIGPHKFIIEHELGHAKDKLDITPEEADNIINIDEISSKIASDPELQRIFNEEKEEMKKVCSKCIQEEADYFINDENHYGGKLGGLREVVAETNAIQNCAKAHTFLQMRTQILMEYFPRTIAYLVNNKL